MNRSIAGLAFALLLGMMTAKSVSSFDGGSPGFPGAGDRNQPFPQGITASAQAAQINSVTWDASEHTVHIGITSWPAVWPGWKMYLDGSEAPMEGGAGSLTVRPNGPVDQPPTGLIAGTLPWVTGLDAVNFPCCGTVQFDIPGEGLTNTFSYNLHDYGCATASTKACPSEWTVHEGDLVIGGTETRVIENAKYFQKGNITVRDDATLIIRNSELMMSRGATPTIHVYLFVEQGATLIFDHARVYPFTGGGSEAGLVCLINRGVVEMTDSPTQIHYFDMSEGAQLSMVRSEMIYQIGGLLQVTGGSTAVTDSTIGALGLRVPAGAHLNETGLHSGMYFEAWDVREMIPEADYDLTLIRSTLLEDDFTGELEYGPYERGWIFFLDRDAHVNLSNSELRKVFFDLQNETAVFHDLKVGIPSSLHYRDITLTDVIVKGEWPFSITNSDVTINDSNYLFLQPTGTSTVRVNRSHIVEFIPRDFFGTMIFDHGLWTCAGEIIGGVPYHSMENDFTIKGSLKIEGVRDNLQWKDAQVTREYDVEVVDSLNRPAKNIVLKINGQSYLTDASGRAKFNIVFNEENYNRPAALEVWRAGQRITSRTVDFFTETPVRIKLVVKMFLPVVIRK